MNIINHGRKKLKKIFEEWKAIYAQKLEELIL
jgi:hypothetical protein